MVPAGAWEKIQSIGTRTPPKSPSSGYHFVIELVWISDSISDQKKQFDPILESIQFKKNIHSMVIGLINA